MKSQWDIVRAGTKLFLNAALDIASLLLKSPYLDELGDSDIIFDSTVWSVLEDLLVALFVKYKLRLETPSGDEEFRAFFYTIQEKGERKEIPWSFCGITRKLAEIYPSEISRITHKLQKLPQDPIHAWFLGSLYEYRTNLLIKRPVRDSGKHPTLIHNPRRKRQAIYYTPPDVVDFILSQVVDPFLNELGGHPDLRQFLRISVLDPACGGGAFLLPVWAKLVMFFSKHFALNKNPPIARPLLVGVDIDERAARVARLSLWLITPIDHPLASGSVVLHGNALGFDLEAPFPEFLRKSGQYTCVVGNPPYAPIPDAWPRDFLERVFRSARSKDLYTLFLEVMVLQGSLAQGRGGMIVPLSLTFSKEMRAIRHYILNSGRHWKISSYHIRPSGIFPGVSQRTSIALVAPSPDRETHIETTCVQRWRAEDRGNLFQKIKYADITECARIIEEQQRPMGFPNVGDSHLKDLMARLLKRGETLGHALAKPQGDPSPTNTLYYFTMAYNWLTISGRLPDPAQFSAHVATTSLIPLAFRSEEDKWAAVALLGSSLGFWWWQSFGDLFHVTRTILAEFPVNPNLLPPLIKGKLVNAARKLQEAIDLHVTTFTKKGVTNANFDLTRCFPEIKAVDEILHAHLGVTRVEQEALYANYAFTTGKSFD